MCPPFLFVVIYDSGSIGAVAFAINVPFLIANTIFYRGTVFAV